MSKLNILKMATTLLMGLFLTLTLAGCGTGEDKTYDIGPIFPASADKCEKYNGEAEGEGIGAKCWVTLADCERAAADWAKAMKNIPDAINFRCN